MLIQNKKRKQEQKVSLNWKEEEKFSVMVSGVIIGGVSRGVVGPSRMRPFFEWHRIAIQATLLYDVSVDDSPLTSET